MTHIADYKNSILGWLSSILFLVAIAYVGYVPSQSDFVGIALPYSIAFLSYLYLLRSRLDFKWCLLLAIVARAILIPAFPNLSDDLYRFYWDGLLTIDGVNPYSVLPTDVSMDDGSEVLEKMNSREYYTIYPPVSQLIFALVSFLSSSVNAASILFKSIMFIAEMSTLWMLFKLLALHQLPKERLFLYALNPLIIIELLGNLHFEGIMLCFFLAAYWFLRREKLWPSAVFMSLSIGAKLMPLIFLPFLIPWLGWKRSIRYFLIMAGCLVVLFLPLYLGVNWSNFGDSLDLYFRKFEFNASIYYIGRYLGTLYRGWNWISVVGPLLALSSLMLILIYLFQNQSKTTWYSFPRLCLVSFTIYLAFATTVHPWYLCFPILLSTFTRYRYPLFWSAVVILSYHIYSTDSFTENLWLITIEYVSVVLFYILYDGRTLTRKVSTM